MLRTLLDKWKRVRGIALPVAAGVLAVVLFSVALYKGDPIWWVLTCFVAVVTVYGLIYTRLSSRCIRVAMLEKGGAVRRGDPFLAQVEVTWRLPMLWSGLYLTYSDTDADGVLAGQYRLPSPAGFLRTVRQTVDLPVITRYKGSYHIVLTGASHHDPIGFFRTGVRVDNPERAASLTVFPRAAEITDQELLRQLRQGAALNQSVAETSLSGENRSYVTGDPLKWVNWKLTARMGELYVKQQEDDASSGINLYLAAVPPADDRKAQREALEIEQLSADEAASVAMQALTIHPRVSLYIYPSMAPTAFGNTGHSDAVLELLTGADLRPKVYDPGTETAIIRENLNQINVAIAPLNAADVVMAQLMELRRGSVLFLNGTPGPHQRQELTAQAQMKGITLIITPTPPPPADEKEGRLC